MPLVVDILMAICQVKRAKKSRSKLALKHPEIQSKLIFMVLCTDKNRIEIDLNL